MVKQNCWLAVILILMLFSIGTSQIQRWAYWYNGPGNSWDEANSLVYGADGNVYIAGASNGIGTYYDFTVISLFSTGILRWVYRDDGPGNDADKANSLVYGADGNIYIAGMSCDIDTSYDFTVISLISTCNRRWEYRYNGQANDWGEAYSLVYGADGNIYIAGYTTGIGTYSDLTVISLTPTGAQRWVYRYNGPGNGSDGAYSLVYGSDGNIYIAGYSWGNGTGTDFTVISLTRGTGIEEETADRLPHFAIRSFGNKIELSFTLSKPANIPISVYNITGEKVLAFDISASAGTSHHEKDLSFLPTGVYIVKADLEQKSINKKIVIIN